MHYYTVIFNDNYPRKQTLQVFENDEYHEETIETPDDAYPKNSCIEVCESTLEFPSDEYPCYIPIPEYNDVYLGKFYIDGEWYLNAEGTEPWSLELEMELKEFELIDSEVVSETEEI